MPQYKIKSGDTLSQIAKKRGFTLKQLMAANPNITDANKIRAGANLKLPYAASKVGSKKTTGATVGGSTKQSPYKGMTKKDMAGLQKKPKAQAKRRKVALTPPPTPKMKPKKAIDRMKRKRLYSTKSPSLGRR
jgi:LysM repeat protein